METSSTPTQPSEPTPPPPPTPGSPPSGAYPVRVEAERQAEYNRLLPLVKWLLAFPHYIVLVLLAIGLLFAVIISAFAVLFTRTYPQGLFDYIVGVFRWGWRVTSYVYLLNDRYPPFSLQPDPAYPASLEVPYPDQGIDRWRPFVHWLLVIPYAIVAGVLTYLAAVVAFIGVFVILFTKDLPEGMFKLILIPYRWQLRALSYGHFLIDRYPPFEWEE